MYFETNFGLTRFLMNRKKNYAYYEKWNLNMTFEPTGLIKL
jgi:hypothetical protein